MLAQGITFDYAQLLIDNEIARMNKEVVGGIRVDRAGPGRISRVCSKGYVICLNVGAVDIPVHTNVGMGVGGMSMQETTALDATSRISKSMAEIGKIDGL